jgi:hypothetical protein
MKRATLVLWYPLGSGAASALKKNGMFVGLPVPLSCRKLHPRKRSACSIGETQWQTQNEARMKLE